MSDVAAAAAASVAARLLAFYREPVAHRPAYLHGHQPMPDGRVVFRLAHGRYPQGWFRDLPARDRDELLAAARAFVRQVCLWERATHHQVLCLGPDAGRDALRENYQLLIALIHPDRQDASAEAWPTGCSQRVNNAYETLADPRKRAAYEEELEASGADVAIDVAARVHADVSPGRSRMRESNGGAGLAKRVVVVTGVVAALFVLQAWWMGGLSPQYSILERAIPASGRWMRDVLPDAPRFIAGGSPAAFDPGERLEPLKPPRRLAALATWVPFAESAPSPPAPPAPASASQAAEQPRILTTVPQLRVAAALAEPAPVVAQAPAAPVKPAAPVRPEAPVKPAEPGKPAEPVAPGPSRDQVESLIALLVGYYDSGDSERLVGLIDPDNLGFWRGYKVRSTYADFFSATRQRRLRMDRLNWQVDGPYALARGEATVVAEYQDGRALERRVPVEIDIALRNGRPRLTRLILFPGGE